MPYNSGLFDAVAFTYRQAQPFRVNAKVSPHHETPGTPSTWRCSEDLTRRAQFRTVTQTNPELTYVAWLTCATYRQTISSLLRAALAPLALVAGSCLS